MTRIGNPSITHQHRVVHPTGGPFYTNNTQYSDPLLPMIMIKTLNKKENLYTFNPFTWNNAAGGVTYCSLSLGTNQHGQFEIEFEDANKTIDDTLIRSPARCYIYFGKSESNFNLMLSGMIRQSGYARGCENNLLYYISGFGTGIRTNERILDVNEAPTKTTRDGVTIDPTDHNFHANRIIDDSVDDGDYYPSNITDEVQEAGSDSIYDYLNSGGVELDSPVEDFIPGVVSRFHEMGDTWQQVEDYTGARAYVDTDDRPQLQPLLTPHSARYGFMITTNPQDTDLADNTMYIMEDYSFTNSWQKDSGYSNGIYGILPADPVPASDHFTDDTYYWQNKDVEVAQRLRLPTNPNWRIFAAVEAVGMSNVASENSLRTRWRLAYDDNGEPGEVFANRYMYPNQHYNTADGGMQTIEIMGRGSNDISVNNYYWLIFSSVNATATEYWRWFSHRLVDQRGESMTASAGTSSDSDAGSGWTATPGYHQMIVTTRFKAEPFGIFDQKSIDNNILIESVAQGFPQQITSKLAAAKYLLGLMQYSARPRRVFQFPSVTVPNQPVFPGDVAYIVDSRFNFSTSGNPVVTGSITDLNYTFGVRNAGLSPNSKGMLSLALNVVGYNQFY